MSETPFFEGCEKKITLIFSPSVKSSGSLRDIPKNAWDRILELAQCRILSSVSNDYVDAYLLSESSLFVYDLKVIVKTCGTTTVLATIPEILWHAQRLGLGEVSYAEYSRGEYMRPEEQPSPYKRFADEVDFLELVLPGGHSAQGVGKWSDDQISSNDDCAAWYLYSYGLRPQEEGDVGEIAMFGLASDGMRPFFKDYYKTKLNPASENIKSTIHGLALKESKFRDIICDDAIVDCWMFDPCGFSLNAIKNKYYWSVHITPEPEHSYVSMETNHYSGDEAALKLVQLLKPGRVKRFSITPDCSNQSGYRIMFNSAAISKVRDE